MGEENGGQAVKNKIIRILVIALLAVIVIAAVIIGSLLERGAIQTSADGGVHLNLDPNAQEYVEPEPQDTQKQGVKIPSWGSITIPPNQTEVTVDFYNPEENKDLYYLTFELRLFDDSEQG